MKKQIITLVITAFMTVIILTNCGEKSKQDAIEVKDDVIELNKDLTRGAINTAEEISTAVKQQWNTFKTASEIAIENTEKEIKELREKISKKNKEERKKLTKKLDELEQKNIVLKDKLAVRTRKFKENMIEFDEKAKAKEKAFEREFDSDIKALNTALKDFFKDNVD